jgi:hypothetical protein
MPFDSPGHTDTYLLLILNYKIILPALVEQDLLPEAVGQAKCIVAVSRKK